MPPNERGFEKHRNETQNEKQNKSTMGAQWELNEKQMTTLITCLTRHPVEELVMAVLNLPTSPPASPTANLSPTPVMQLSNPFSPDTPVSMRTVALQQVCVFVCLCVVLCCCCVVVVLRCV